MNFLANNNYDFFTVGTAIAAIGVLGFTVFFSNRKSITNRSLLYLSTAALFWGLFNYFYYKITNIQLSFFVLKLVMFCAVWLVFFLFKLLYVFPEENKKTPKWFTYAILPLTCLISFLTLTSLVFEKVTQVSEGHISQIQNGSGIIVFGVFVVALILGGLVLFYKKTYLKTGRERNQFVLVWSGFFVTFFLLLTFNFVLPAFFNTPKFIQLGGIFLLPMVIFMSLAIYRHGLFNVKVITTATLVFILSVAILFEAFFSESFIVLLFRLSIFLLVLSIGILLIRSVIREVLQREKIQMLADELDIANKRQSELLYFVTHQVKGFLTNTKGALSMLLEGDYGKIPDEIQGVLLQTLKSESSGVDMVQGFLNASKIEQGTMQYEMKVQSLKDIIKNILSEQKINLDSKKLFLRFNAPEGDDFNVKGDKAQLREALYNLVDNSIKYTPSGEISVNLERKDGKILFSIKDTGVGITDEDKLKLFTKYGHGRDSRTVNVNSNGLGLYLVKKIVEDHGGKVWSESMGKGKGSQFYVQFNPQNN